MLKNSKKKAFTIIELVIVIAVVAVLAAVLIPTFAHLINEANMSVDEQLVRQINTILDAEEKLGNKAALVTDAQEILKKNGIANFVANFDKNTIYWISSENRALIWTADGDTGKVTYPDNYAKKFESYNVPSTDWKKLADEARVIALEEASENAILEAIGNLGAGDSNVTIQMPSNSNVEIGGYALIQKMSNQVGNNNNVSIDLNGSTLNFGKVESGYYGENNTPYTGKYGISIPNGSSLEITNGSVDFTQCNFSNRITVDDYSSLVLRDVVLNITSNGAGTAIFPASNASEVVIENCTINHTGGGYCIMTNGITSNNIKVIIRNTTLKSDATQAILINKPSELIVENSTIEGNVSAITMRAGNATIKNSTLKAASTTAGIFKWNGTDIDKHTGGSNPGNGYWADGNVTAAGVLVLGDHSRANDDKYEGVNYSYEGDVNCTLENVVLESVTSEIPEILIAARFKKNVTLNCSEADATKVQLYNWPHKFGHGTVVVNGETKTFTDDKQ